MKYIKVICLALLSLSLLPMANAEVKFNGFGSVVMGQTLTHQAPFTADFYDVGQYSDKPSFKPETVFALQATADVSQDLKFTGQYLTKGTDEFETELDWYYLTFSGVEDWTFMAGRRNIPMYYYSEFSEVGFAYPWIRPPANLYWWQITQFNGVHASYDFEIGDLGNTITAFYGNEYSIDNKEMLFYDKLFAATPAASSIDEIWTDIVGFNYSLVGEFFDLRFVYFQNHRNRTTYHVDGTVTEMVPFDQTFMGFGGNVNLDMFTILFDMNLVIYDNEVELEYPTWLVSLVYNIGKYQPYVVYSQADETHGDDPAGTNSWEQHFTAGVGVRYNLSSSAALKVQYDYFEDQGDVDHSYDYHGDSETIAVALDFIF